MKVVLLLLGITADKAKKLMSADIRIIAVAALLAVGSGACAQQQRAGFQSLITPPKRPAPEVECPLALHPGVTAIIETNVTYGFVNYPICVDGQEGMGVAPDIVGVHRITIAQSLQNVSAQKVTFQSQMYGYNYHWRADRPAPDATNRLVSYAGGIGPPEKGGDRYNWPRCCQRVGNPRFETLLPGETTLLGNPQTFDVPICAKAVLYEASIIIIDNGSDRGMNAWTGIVHAADLHIGLTNRMVTVPRKLPRLTTKLKNSRRRNRWRSRSDCGS